MKGRRRALLLAVGAPLLLCAQPARRPYYRIGFLGAEENRYSREFVDALRDLGYEEGRHYTLLARYYGAERSRIPAAAEALVALAPEVIVANVSSTAVVLKAKTSTIPIVFATAIDPVAEGLVESLAHPGGNVTGLTSLSQAVHPKLIEFAHLLLPRAKRFAFVVNPDHALARSHEALARRAARGLGVELVALRLRAAWELETLAGELARLQADALVVSADATLFALREGLVRAGLEAGVPTLSVLSEFTGPGALATYGHDLAANFRGAARYVERILKGARPAALPVEQPTQFELVINVRTAKALRITIPQAVLLRADRVVE